MDHLDLRKEIVQTCRRMRASGLVAGTEGNVSARTPDGNVLITPSGLDYAVTEPEELEEHYRQRNVLKVNVLPDNIADAVLHFASEARSSRSTGNVLNVDGGVKDSYPR